MFNNTSIYSESWCRTVFADRNQAYGAFELRKLNERNTLLGLLLTTTLVLSASFYVTFKNHGTPNPDPVSSLITVMQPDTLSVVEMHLQDNPPAPESPAAAPEVKAPEPVTETPEPTPVENAAIKVVKEVAETETAPITNAAAANATASAATTTGSTGNGTTEGIVGGKQGGTGISTNTDAPIVIAEHMPEFPGGTAALMNYIRNNVSYPGAALEMGKEGTVYVSFIVERSGEVSNVKVEKSVFQPLDREAIRVIKGLPKWKPGSQNGQTVRVQFTVPIRFVQAS